MPLMRIPFELRLGMSMSFNYHMITLKNYRTDGDEIGSVSVEYSQSRKISLYTIKSTLLLMIRVLL